MAFTKLYLTNRTAPYTPATIRGAWDDTAGAVTKAIDPLYVGGGEITSVARAETSTSDEYDVLLYRGVSGPLATQEIDVTLNLVVGIRESSISQNAHWHVHVYTTQGDSDTIRETIIDNYREAAGTNEWPTTAVGKTLNAAQSAHIHTTAGDRLVVELGYASRNTSATSYTGTLWYGCLYGSEYLGDLTDGGDETTLAGIITFSSSVAEQDLTSRVSQSVVEALTDPAETVRVSQSVVEALTDPAETVRVSQAVVEALVQVPAPTRVTHLLAETVSTETTQATLVTQIVIETISEKLPSPSVSPSVSVSVSPSVSESASPSISVSPSESESASPSVSESVSPSVSESVSPSFSISESPSVSPSVSESASPSVSESVSPSASPSVSESVSPSVSASASPSVSASASPSPSEAIPGSESPSVSPSVSASESASLSASVSPSESASSSPSPSYEPPVEARVTQIIVEVADELTPTAQVTQAVVEVADDPAPTARVSHAVVEVADDPGPPIRISQIVVEVLVRPRLYECPWADPGISLCGSDAVLTWIEQTQFLAGSDDTTTRYESDIVLPDPSTYYGGKKEARVLSWGAISRRLSDVQGQWQGSTMTWRERG